MTNIFEQRVARGIAHLDSVDRSLLDGVNIDSLNLVSRCQCVLGQIAHIVIDPVEVPGFVRDFDAFIRYPDWQPHGLPETEEDRFVDPKFANTLLFTEKEAIDLGFTLKNSDWGDEHEDSDANWAWLTEEWKRQLTIRATLADLEGR